MDHGRQAKEIVAIVKVETDERRPGPKRLPKQVPEQSFHDNKKKTLTVKAKHSLGPQPMKRGTSSTRGDSSSNQTCPTRQYFFKDEHVESLLKLLSKSNKLKLPEA